MTFVDFFNTVLGIGTIIGQVIAFVFLVLLFVPKARNSVIGKLAQKYAYPLAFVSVLGAVVGSLIYSNVIGYEPCNLCWIQRIFMYPILIILAIAFIRKELKLISPYVLWLAGIGGFFGIYQYLLQFGLVSDAFCASSAVSCLKVYVVTFGYITIPLMSLTVWLLIFLPIFLSRKMDANA